MHRRQSVCINISIWFKIIKTLKQCDFRGTASLKARISVLILDEKLAGSNMYLWGQQSSTGQQDTKVMTSE